MTGPKSVDLPFTPVKVFPLGFGCSQLMSRAGRRQSLRAVHAALDGGVNYFDVARAYGYGEAEGLLGEALAGRREQVVLATKFGIAPPKTTRTRALAKALLRPVFRKLPALRAAARGTLGSQFSAGHFSPEELRASLEASLRGLRTDHVDLLLVHDCSEAALADDRLFEALDAVVREGKARAHGLSGSAELLRQALGRGDRRPAALQLRYGLLDQSALPLLDEAPRGPLRIAHGPFAGGGALARIQEGLARLSRDPSISEALRSKLSDPSPHLAVHVALAAPLSRGRVDLLLTSMVEERYVAANLAALRSGQFTDDELEEIRRGFAALA